MIYEKSKKLGFVFKIDNVIDIITNSSSELFVLASENQNTAKQMVRNVYSDYLTEYEEPKSIRDCTVYELNNYLNYAYKTYVNEYSKRNVEYLKLGMFKMEKYSFEEMYDVRETTNCTSIDLKDNFVEDHFNEIIDAIDPEGQLYFLFSIGENPVWEYQERLSEIGRRFHLG